MKQDCSTSQKGFGSVWTGLALAALLTLFGAAGAPAALIGTPGYSVGAPLGTDPGNFYSIGFEFTPTSSFDVTALGYWDRDNNGLFVFSHQVAIYKVSDQSVVASATVFPADSNGGLDTIGNSPDGSYAYHPLTASVRLEQGVLYRIAANTYPDINDYTRWDLLATPTYLAPMTVIRGVYDIDNDPNVSYPTSTDTINIYSVPNFLFTIPAPEPSAVALLALGGLVVAWRRRKTAE